MLQRKSVSSLLLEADDRLACLDRALVRELDGSKIVGVRESHDNDGVMASSLDLVLGEGKQRLACLHMSALLAVDLEALALHLDRVDADMDQDLCSVIALDAKSVV